MIAEWLRLHELSIDILADCIGCIKTGYLRLDLDGPVAAQVQATPDGFETIDSAISNLIVPAFSAALHIESSETARLIQSIRWTSASDGDTAHTIDHGPGQSPEIVMSWNGSPSDLICLAHEIAHAVQLTLSDGSFMPPVARETCAFLGELALLKWATKNDPDLAAKLLLVWQEENERYIGDDCELLLAALADPRAAYSYRMNYPLARAAAVVLWRAGADIQQLFKAGSAAMAYLPLGKIADIAGQTQNYLPPLSPPAREQPAAEAYRVLGAIALLDIDFWNGEPERRIEDYYASHLQHLQDGTAFIALDEVRRPVGYVTWRNTADDNTITLTRQAAPFGDHLLLQKAFERHIGQKNDVHACHPRSARQRQLAW